jgi:hypothetical protein
VKAEVQLLNEKGRPLPVKERKLLPTYRGRLRFHEARSGELGRITPMAVLVSDIDTTATPLVPSLHDAAVLFVKDGVMRMRGFEVVDGAQYGQTWHIKVS